ncbi:GtrA family protein [Methyloterricola oryzae]|uniref:GtrA family protein n=1 Tax=Methyloterricola oryzae TaxID=1495050 RepID=UPI0009E507E5|nr:GtrA family protein [Methyloterricola oryzae]
MKVILRKFILFVAVGGTATAIQYLILILLVQFRHWHPTWASTLGFIVSSLFNYALNYAITFKSTRGHLSALPRFVFMAGTGLGLNGLILEAGLRYSAWPYIGIQLAATVVVLFWNFVASLTWTFAAPKPKPAPPSRRGKRSQPAKRKPQPSKRKDRRK